jgi:hypothetical protein
MRDSLRRVISGTPLQPSASQWPAWTAEVLTYVAVFGHGLTSPAPDRVDRASCMMVAAVLLHKDSLAAAAAAEGVTAAASRACIPKCAGARACALVRYLVCFCVLLCFEPLSGVTAAKGTCE